MDYKQQIEQYSPYNEQEKQDRAVALGYIRTFDNILTRENEFAHITASSWIVNPSFTKVIMIYHTIYDSFAWTGGHADGDGDLLAVAVREAREETGLKKIKAVSEEIYSLELLCVNGHEKRGSYVSSHIHINVTYLLMAKEEQPLTPKPDENSAVKWVDLWETVDISSEPPMKRIYQKLNEKLTEQRKKNKEVKVYVDADACPVVKQIEAAAKRKAVPVVLLCDTNHVLHSAYSEIQIIGAGADAVDFALINRCQKGDIVVTQDYGVAALALGKGAYAIHQSGRWYTNENIDQLLMERHIAKAVRRASGKHHVKGSKKRKGEEDESFLQSFERLLDTAL